MNQFQKWMHRRVSLPVKILALVLAGVLFVFLIPYTLLVLCPRLDARLNLPDFYFGWIYSRVYFARGFWWIFRPFLHFPAGFHRRWNTSPVYTHPKTTGKKCLPTNAEPDDLWDDLSLPWFGVPGWLNFSAAAGDPLFLTVSALHQKN